MANYWIPTYLKDMGAYIKNPDVYMYGRWDNPPSAMEGGVDLASPGGTPVYALASGPIVGLGNFWHCADLYNPNCGGNPGYGVVTTRVNIPGYGSNDLYYQHIDITPRLKVGDNVTRGQRIGTIRSNVGELEMGLNADWGGVWGTNHPNAWATDPRPQIKALMAMGTPGTNSSSSSSSGTVDIHLVDFVTSVINNLRNKEGVTSTLGQSPSKNIINFMIAWSHQEGGSQTNACSFNVLNTMQDESGAVQCPNTLPGIKSYPDVNTGEKALEDALTNGLYPSLLHALTTNDEINLGFTRRGSPSFANMMAANVAGDLSMWVHGKRSPVAQSYILSIMSEAGINNPSIEGGTANGGPGTPQTTIDQWGQAVIGTGAVTDNNPLDSVASAFQGLSNTLQSFSTFFGNLNSLFSDPTRVIKIMIGSILLVAGVALLIKQFTPTSVQNAAKAAIAV